MMFEIQRAQRDETPTSVQFTAQRRGEPRGFVRFPVHGGLDDVVVLHNKRNLRIAVSLTKQHVVSIRRKQLGSYGPPSGCGH
jgi:hypothetical protein